MWSTLLYSTLLCCTVLYCTVLYCTVLYCTEVGNFHFYNHLHLFHPPICSKMILPLLLSSPLFTIPLLTLCHLFPPHSPPRLPYIFIPRTPSIIHFRETRTLVSNVLPIIGMSTNTDQYSRDCALLAGMTLLIAKPFTTSELQAVLDTFRPRIRGDHSV